MLDKFIQKFLIYSTLILVLFQCIQPSLVRAETVNTQNKNTNFLLEHEAKGDKDSKLHDDFRGLLFIVSAPAGTGKTTLVQMLMKEFPSVVASVSYTTRKPRLGEIPDIHYHFIDEAAFEEKIAQGEFLEYVKLYGNYYGTSRKKVLEQQLQGKHVILVIDTQGALQLKNKIEAKYIFIQPPGLDVLRERLTARGTESPEVIEERLACVNREIQQGQHYDYHIVNDNLETAYGELRKIVMNENPY